MVLEIGAELGLTTFRPGLPGAQEPTIPPHSGQDELRIADRGGDVVRTPHRRTSLGEGPAGEAIPGGEHLVIETGMNAALAGFEEAPPRRGDPLRRGLSGHEEDILALEVGTAV